MDLDNIERDISKENVKVAINTDAENNHNIEITSMKGKQPITINKTNCFNYQFINYSDCFMFFREWPKVT